MSNVYQIFNLELYHPETGDDCSIEFDLKYVGYYYYPQTREDPSDEGYQYCEFEQNQIEKLNELFNEGWLIDGNDISDIKKALGYIERAGYAS